MEIANVLILGGSGFIGRHVAERLSAQSIAVTVPSRHAERARALLVLPTIDVVEADIHEPATLGRLMQGQQVVINLVGILHGGRGVPYGAAFAKAHVDLPRKIARAAREAGVARLLHVSALKAAADAPSAYLRSKAAGEAAILGEAGRTVTIFRPSVVFGKGDRFLTLFAGLQRHFPVLPLACADAQFQPVWVEDVAASIVESMSRAESFGRTYELCGPRRYTLRELVALAGHYGGHARPIIALPAALGRIQARAMELLPHPPMTRDNIASMQVPNICEGGCSLPFGLVPTPLESVAPLYLRGEDQPSDPYHLRYKPGL